MANAKKRERERARRPIHIKRIVASLEPLTASHTDDLKSASDHQKTYVRLLLNDISTKGAGIFSPVAFLPGQSITVNILEPEPLSLKAKIVWCQEFQANSHVISNQPHTFRMGIVFILTPSEEQTLKTFCESVAKNHLFSSGMPTG